MRWIVGEISQEGLKIVLDRFGIFESLRTFAPAFNGPFV